MKYLLLAFILVLTGCSHGKIVVKNCEKAGNADLYVCDPI